MIKLKYLLTEIYVPGFVSSKEAKPFRTPENFDVFKQGNGWSIYRGGNDWENGTTRVCAYIGPEGYTREQVRVWFEVKFPEEIKEFVSSNKGYDNPGARSVREWGDRAVRKWMIEVHKIHRKSNPIKRIKDTNHLNWRRKTWKECFIEALTLETMKPYVKNWGVDHTRWFGMKREEINESFHRGSGWFVHEGFQSISVIFESGKTLSFELGFKSGKDRDKWRKSAASKWSSIAREIYNNPDLNEIGNPKQQSWEECFREALMDERMKPYIKSNNVSPVFDPVNFTPRV